MSIDRSSLKLDAKGKARGAVLKVSLIYLLLTGFVPALLERFYSGSLSDYGAATDWEILWNGGIYQVITSAPSNLTTMVAFFSILIVLIVDVIQYGYFYYTMKVARQEQDNGISDLFYGFRMVGKIILLQLYTYLLAFLWSLLFIIPGIIAVYRYAMAPYILLDDPSISVTEAVRRSKVMMKGYKGELFVLQISFIGWLLLGALASAAGAGIGYLIGNSVVSVILEFALSCIVIVWLNAYMQIAEINFYDAINGRRRGLNGQQYNGNLGDSDDQNHDPWN